jgi:H+/Cl- antiporter ClcA
MKMKLGTSEIWKYIIIGVVCGVVGFFACLCFFKFLTQEQVDKIEWGNWLAAVGTIAAVGVSIWQNDKQQKQYEAQLDV